jgi:hypothetical protein
MKNLDTQVEETVAKLSEGKISVEEAVGNLLGDSGVKVGASVAVLGDPTYPFNGQKGVVRKMSEGYADVEFPNGAIVPLQCNLLVPV